MAARCRTGRWNELEKPAKDQAIEVLIIAIDIDSWGFVLNTQNR